MTPDEYKTATSRRDDLERKLEARKRVGEGYTANSQAITDESARLDAEIGAYEAEAEDGGEG